MHSVVEFCENYKQNVSLLTPTADMVDCDASAAIDQMIQLKLLVPFQLVSLSVFTVEPFPRRRFHN